MQNNPYENRSFDPNWQCLTPKSLALLGSMPIKGLGSRAYFKDPKYKFLESLKKKNTKVSSIEGAALALKKKRKEWLNAINSTREMTLANLLMLSQIPAPTFYEKDRAEFILNRFSQTGGVEPKTDILHNAIGIYRTAPQAKTILVCTHMDNDFDRKIDQNITITAKRVNGAGVADDNLALAVLMTLPDILNRLNLVFNSNLILLATTGYHGQGDFGGIRHFIKQNEHKIDAVVDLSGINLGEVNYFTRSRVRCNIHYNTRKIDAAMRQNISDSNAILVLNELIDALMRIPLPKKPPTELNIGMIKGGEGYSTPCQEGSIQLEAQSESNDIMDNLIEEIKNRCTDIGVKHGTRISTSFFGCHKASNIISAHPLIKSAMSVIKTLGYEPQLRYCSSQISVTLAEGIPSINIGITQGMGGSTSKSYIDIPRLSDGVLQLVMLLYLLDKEDANE